jgi:hypothetical protein
LKYKVEAAIMHLLKFFLTISKTSVGKRIKQLLLIWNAVDGFQMITKSKELIAINIPASINIFEMVNPN